MNIINIAKTAVAVVTVGVAVAGIVHTVKKVQKLHVTAVDAIQKAENDEIESDEQMDEISNDLNNAVKDVTIEAGAFMLATAAVAVSGYLFVSEYSEACWRKSFDIATKFDQVIMKDLSSKLDATRAVKA